MAAPDSITTVDLSGKWVMNKTLSDSSDKILELQGVSWFKRKAIALATITLDVKHFKDPETGVERIDIDQTLTGGISGTSEKRILDWTEREHEDHIFGAMIGRSRRLAVDQVDDEFLKNDWLQDTIESGLINSYVSSNTAKSGRTWTAEQTWGFEKINDERRYTRHVKFDYNNGEQLIKIKLFYDRL